MQRCMRNKILVFCYRFKPRIRAALLVITQAGKRGSVYVKGRPLSPIRGMHLAGFPIPLSAVGGDYSVEHSVEQNKRFSFCFSYGYAFSNRDIRGKTDPTITKTAFINQKREIFSFW